MRLTETRLSGWSLLVGTTAVAVGYALSPGRGAVDTVPSNSLTDLTLAMARNKELSYTVPVLILLGGLLMLHGILTLRRYAGPVPRLGLLGMAIGLVLQMVMRGLDYMITGMGVAALERGAEREEWLGSALEMQRMVYGLQFTSIVLGLAGAAILALGLALRPQPLRMRPALNVIVAVLAVAALGVFIAAWHSDTLELALAPVFAAMSLGGIVYMGLLGWGLASSEGNGAAGPGPETP
jgi:hypothetical protein